MKRIILLVCLGLNFFFGSAKTFTSLSNSKFRFINQKLTEPLFHSFDKVFNNYSEKKDKNNLPPCDVTANISYASAPFCFSITTPQSVSLTGNGIYTGGVFASVTGLTINPNTGAITPSTSTPGSYIVTYTVSGGTGCPNVVASTTVVINSVPVVANQNFTTCSDVIIGFILGTTPSTTYNITSINSNGVTASAGNPAPGTGLLANVIANDAWTNTTPSPVDVVYTVVPVSAAGCQGDPFTVTVTVNPSPCSGFHLNAFLDSNSNGTQDSGENNFPFGQFIYQVNSITHNVATVTGMYDIFESNAASIYTLQYSINPQLSSYFSVTPTSYTNVQIASTGGITTYNFPITINQLNDLGITLIPLGSPVPGFNFQNLILYFLKHP